MQRLKAEGFGISGNFTVKSGIACDIWAKGGRCRCRQMSRASECVTYRPLAVERGTPGESTHSLQTLCLKFCLAVMFFRIRKCCCKAITPADRTVLRHTKLYNSLIKYTTYMQVLNLRYELSRLYVRITSFTLKISIQFCLIQYVGLK